MTAEPQEALTGKTLKYSLVISTAEWIPWKQMTSLSKCKAVLNFHLVIQFKTESFHIGAYVSHGGVFRVSRRKLARCVTGTRTHTGVECTFRIVDNPVTSLHCVSHRHLALYTQHTSTTSPYAVYTVSTCTSCLIFLSFSTRQKVVGIEN